MTKALTSLGVLAVASLLYAAPAEQTFTNAVISDSHCGAIHKTDIEHGGSITARECVIGRAGDPNLPGCVSEKYGAKFVVVVGEKVYQVATRTSPTCACTRRTK